MKDFFSPLQSSRPFKLLVRTGKNLVPRLKEYASLHYVLLAAAVLSRGSGQTNAVVVFNMATGEYPAIFKNGRQLPARFFLYRGQKLLASDDDEKHITELARHHSRQSHKPVILYDEVHGWRHTYTKGRETFSAKA